MSKNPKSTRSTTGDTSFMTPEWLYDEIMRHIEPDLVSTRIPLLAEKYKNETEEEGILRQEKYTYAFDLFNLALENFSTTLLLELNEWSALMRKQAAVQQEQEESGELTDIEQKISSSNRPS